MTDNGAFESLRHSDRHAGVGAHLHTKTTADAALFNEGAVDIGKIEADGPRPQWTDGDASTADATIHPGIAGALIDLSHPHCDCVPIGWLQGVGRTDQHAFTTQDAPPLLGHDVGCIDLSTALTLVKLDTAGRADLAAKSATDTGFDKGRVRLQSSRWTQF